MWQVILKSVHIRENYNLVYNSGRMNVCENVDINLNENVDMKVCENAAKNICENAAKNICENAD